MGVYINVHTGSPYMESQRKQLSSFSTAGALTDLGLNCQHCSCSACLIVEGPLIQVP